MTPHKTLRKRFAVTITCNLLPGIAFSACGFLLTYPCPCPRSQSLFKPAKRIIDIYHEAKLKSKLERASWMSVTGETLNLSSEHGSNTPGEWTLVSIYAAESKAEGAGLRLPGYLTECGKTNYLGLG